MPRVRINGIDRYYQEAGGGPPLLLINGLGGTALNWEPLVPALAEHFRVITSDNRGVGRSDAPPGPYTVRQMADDAEALLAHLGVERAHLVGVSMGGMIAQELVLSYPGVVDRLVPCGTCARLRRAIADPWLDFAAQAAERLDAVSNTIAWLPWLYTPAFFADPERMEAAIAWQNPYPAPPHGIAAQVEAIRHHDTLDRLGQIAAPVLVLVGPDDVTTPPYFSREIANRIPNAMLQVLPAGGHDALWEYPEAGIAALLEFLLA